MKPKHSIELPRVLGPWMAVCVVVGTVIGSGIFKKPSAVAASVPDFGLAMVAWVLVGVITLMGSLALAEVAILYPRAGGNYVFLREGYGKWAGFLWGWVEFWIIRSGSIGALATIFTESLHEILRQARGMTGNEELLTFWPRQGVTITVIAVLGWINARGTRWGGALQLVITFVKVFSLLSIALLPWIVMALALEVPTPPTVERLQPLWPSDWSNVDWRKFGTALIGIFWAYHGWMNIAPVAEEVKNPSRNIPRALLLGTLTVIVLYLSVNLGYYLVIESSLMPSLGNRTVAAEFCVRLFGPIGAMLASLAVMISVFGALNGNLLVGPRLLFAMGKDGLGPRWLTHIHPSFETPYLAQATLTSWTILMVVGAGCLLTFGLPVFHLGDYTFDLNLPPGANPFDLLTDYAMFGALSFETLAVASIFIFRARFPVGKVELPYRCPLFPVLPTLFVLAQFAVLGNMFTTRPTESLFGVGFMVTGALVYCGWFRNAKALDETPASSIEETR